MMKGTIAIINEEANQKSGTLSSDQNLATAWLATGSSAGIAFKPYLVTFKGGTVISFYKDGKVHSGTLAVRQDLVKSIPSDGGKPDYVSVNAGTVVQFNKDGFVTGL
ncbi:MAG: hypothetical protein CVV51_10770 [Spirochaetae bacterium HGW-Spirochaetae-7]|jgi:plastocyanin|nr:MAG: hypothetical protein CVV51_10770 [Spirochaetae bacterium HGW-Spirochaetae-7]